MKRLKSYNKIMVLGTAAVNEDGELYLSPIAKSRCDRAAEAYFGYRFKRTMGSLLITGGYCKALDETPAGREARIMADYLINQYDISPRALLVEDESTSTEENFEFSLRQYPDFFANVEHDGERKLGLVSHPDHLERAVRIGGRVLDCSERQFAQLATRELLYVGAEVVALEPAADEQKEEAAAA